MEKRLIEKKAIVFTLFILAAVIATGTLLYRKLTDVSQNMAAANTKQIPASFLTQQLLNELRSAENNVRSYHLTNDTYYLTAFSDAEKALEKHQEKLVALANTHEADKPVIDSVVVMSIRVYELLKYLSKAEDPGKITNELTIIEEKIDETYTRKEEQVVPEVEKPVPVEVKEKRNFFQRLFNKEKEEVIVEPIKEEKISALEKENEALSKKQLKQTVLMVKNAQLKQLELYKKNEYLYTKNAHLIRERIEDLAQLLKTNEDIAKLETDNKTKSEISNITYLSLVFSIIISLLLFTLIYYTISFLRKRKEYELSLIESKTRSEELIKTKESFLANMSHEIKTPLNAIHGFTEQLLLSDLDKEQQRQLTIVKNSSEYLTKLVSNILTYSKLQAGKEKLEYAPVNLVSELREIEALFLPQTKDKGIALLFVMNEFTSEIISTDIHKIKQILFNLVGNAIKFTSEGKVTLTVKTIQKKSGLCMEISVKDTGKGIDEAVLPKLFNEYEQGDDTVYKTYGGTGLGLVISKKIIEQLGGQISIESKVGVGTEVVVVIPFIEEKLNALKPIAKKTEPLSAKISGKRVLIVDDEPLNLLLFKSILQKYKVEIYQAVNGEDAVSKARELTLDAIVMDIRMPVKNGIEATEEIRKFNATIPILGSTAVSTEEKIIKCMQAGMTGMIFKPFAESDLIAKLQDAFGKRFVSMKTQANGPGVENPVADIINLGALDQYVNDDNAFKRELIDLFHKSLNKTVVEIETFAKENNYAAISRVAHKIIPSCKHFEANQLVATLKYFEGINRNTAPDTNEINKYITSLKQQATLIDKKLKQYIELSANETNPDSYRDNDTNKVHGPT